MRRLRVIAATLAAGALLATACGTASAAPSDTTRIAVIGDSLTTGYGVQPWQSWTYRFEARQAGDNILPIGANGATARRWLQQYLPQLDQLRTWKPRTVMIALGGNEYHMTRSVGEYADHLRQLIVHVRTVAPGAKIMLLHYYRIVAEHEPQGCDAIPGDPVQCAHAQPPDSWDVYGQAMRATAAVNGAAYLDIAHTRDWAPYQFDQAHLTPEGHRLYELDLQAALTAAP
jgi:lysophospholipase L1-like esterase